PPIEARSERPQERHQARPARGGQRREAVARAPSLTVVRDDRGLDGVRASVVQEGGEQPQAPERGRCASRAPSPDPARCRRRARPCRGAGSRSTTCPPHSRCPGRVVRGTTRRRRGAVAESDTIRYRLDAMKTLSVTEVARNFRAVLDSVERDQEEIVLVRNRRQIARLVPEAPRQ